MLAVHFQILDFLVAHLKELKNPQNTQVSNNYSIITPAVNNVSASIKSPSYCTVQLVNLQPFTVICVILATSLILLSYLLRRQFTTHSGDHGNCLLTHMQSKLYWTHQSARWPLQLHGCCESYAINIWTLSHRKNIVFLLISWPHPCPDDTHWGSRAWIL